MTLLMPRIAAMVFNTPLVVEPGKAAAFLSGLGVRITGQPVALEGFPAAIDHTANGGVLTGVVGQPMARAMAERNVRPYAMVDGVAVIGVEGTLVHKGTFIGQDSGETSCEGLQAQIAMVGRDSSVKGVVFELDSFGGMAAGVDQTAAMIADLSAVKPTMAILTDNACSGGYWLASACRQIVAPEMAIVGSIGALIVHLDVSRAADQQGVTATVIRAGDRKAMGLSIEPLSAETRAEMQATVDQAREIFATAVGRYRGKRLTKAQALATEAAVFNGPDALSLGLIDAVANPHDAFAAFVAAVNRS
jgi:signal peptide peptidase SppA